MELSQERERIPEAARMGGSALLLYLALLATAAGIAGGWPEPWLLLPGLLTAGAVLTLGRRRRLQMLAVVAPIALVLILLPFWNTAALGMEILYNRLCDASEARNAYHYLRFSLSLTPEEERVCAGCGVALASAVLGALAAGGAVRRGIALALFLGVAAGEVYFGVTPGLAATVLFGCALGISVLKGRENRGLPWRQMVLALGLCLAVALAVQLTVPGVNQPLEDWSEAVRDRFGILEQKAEVQVEQTMQEWQENRHESRLDEEEAGDRTDSAVTEEYDRQEEYEDEISRPEVVDWRKGLLMALLILLLLVGPFVPFILLDRRRRQAQARRADFASEDCSRAVQAMFLHTAAWLEAAGLKRGNRLFSACVEEVRDLMDASYAQAWEEGITLWQAAAYSPHPSGEEERERMKHLLETTEATIYGRAGRLEKFRLKYVRCLAG